MLTVYGGLIIGVPLSSDASSDIQSDNDTPLPGEPGSPYLDIGDAEEKNECRDRIKNRLRDRMGER